MVRGEEMRTMKSYMTVECVGAMFYVELLWVCVCTMSAYEVVCHIYGHDVLNAAKRIRTNDN